MRKTTKKNHSLEEAKKYVETYSSSNAATQYPEERGNKPGWKINECSDILQGFGKRKLRQCEKKRKESGQT